MALDQTTGGATAFAADFATADREAWRAAAEAALKGRPLEPVIRRRTLDGVTVEGIAERTTPRIVAGRPAGARWTAMARIDLADPEEANAQALEDLNNGASGLSIVFARLDDGGLAADTLDRLDRALDGVLLDLAPIHLEVPAFEGRMIAALFAALVERRELDPASVNVLFGLDLLRDLAMTGALPKSWADMCRRVASVVGALRRRGFASPVLTVDARAFHGAGASGAQELAGALASATDQIRGLASVGVDIEVAADAISFAFACDADQFASIAKLRAARLLWAAWRRASGLPERPVHIHAETSRRMMTQHDAPTNMVRTTIAAFAAGVGGADSVTVSPYTAALGPAGADGRRLARNTQSIILEESNAYRVADPAAGAGAIEALTDRLAEHAWGLFREIEREGGMLTALRRGSWQARLAETRSARAAAVARRMAPIVGVSEFPQADETIATRERARTVAPAPAAKPLATPIGEDEAGFEAIVEAFRDGASFADVRAAWKPQPEIVASPLVLERLSEPFERIRAEVEAATPRPAAFLALVGPIAKHGARAGFIRNLLAAGGIRAVDGSVAADPAAIAEAYAASGARLAVVCGSDDGYAEAGAEVVAALKARGARVWLAGRPKGAADALNEAGVERMVAAGDDALAVAKAAIAATSHTAGGA